MRPAADGARPVLTRSAASSLAHNNLEIADSAYLIVRGLTLTGGSIAGTLPV